MANPVRQAARELAMVIARVPVRAIARKLTIAADRKSSKYRGITDVEAIRVVVEYVLGGSRKQSMFFLAITRRDSTSCRVIFTS